MSSTSDATVINYDNVGLDQNFAYTASMDLWFQNIDPTQDLQVFLIIYPLCCVLYFMYSNLFIELLLLLLFPF